MEHEGVKIDVAALREFGLDLERSAGVLAERIQGYTDWPFNLNSPKQLGEVLFDRLKLADKPKKTATGQYQTNEQTLAGARRHASHHQGHPRLPRGAPSSRTPTSMRCPETVNPRTGRVHTTFHQLMAATGRMASSDPNLQNIPIRTEQGREIRKAFVPERRGLGALLAPTTRRSSCASWPRSAATRRCSRPSSAGSTSITATAARVYGVALDRRPLRRCGARRRW